jgi:gliding motility-associated-like protein
VVLWSPIDFIDDSTSFNTAVNVSESAYFVIKVTDSNQCQASDTAHTIAQKQFDAKYIDTCYVMGESLGPAFNYQWNASEVDKKWLSCTDCPIQTIKVNDEVGTLNYTLLYHDTLGCFSNEINYEICIHPRYSFDVPSAFTPDGDGINDVIYLRGHGIKSIVEFKIFNRWGEQVFESKELSIGWDGTYKGMEQNIETYGYQATVEFYNGERSTKGGSITLVR